MDEKKLEKLIADGFTQQDKKIESIKKSIEIDMVTQDDIDQKFDDLSTRSTKRFDDIDEQFVRLNIKIDKLDQRTNEDVAVLVKTVNQLRDRVKNLEDQVVAYK